MKPDPCTVTDETGVGCESVSCRAWQLPPVLTHAFGVVETDTEADAEAETGAEAEAGTYAKSRGSTASSGLAASAQLAIAALKWLAERMLGCGSE